MITYPEAIKDLFDKEGIIKNYKVHFPNGEFRDLTCNGDIEMDSVEFAESICSQDELAFGLNERSTFSFTTKNLTPVRDAVIEVYLEIDISSLINYTGYYETLDARKELPELYELHGIRTFKYYPVKLGVFVIDSCDKDTDMKKRRVVAYSKEITLKEGCMNPYERAKFDSLSNVRFGITSNSKFKMNASCFAISNLYKTIWDKFEDNFTGLECQDGEITTIRLYSNNTDEAKIFDVYMDIKISGKKYKIQNDELDGLYRFKSSNISIAKKKELSDTVKRLIKTYDLNSSLNNEYSRNFNFVFDKNVDFSKGENFVNSLLGNMIKFPRVNSDGNYEFKYLFLDGYKYVYPYVGYSSTDLTNIKKLSTDKHLYELSIPTSYEIKVTSVELLEETVIFDETYSIFDESEVCEIGVTYPTPNYYPIRGIWQVNSYYTIDRFEAFTVKNNSKKIYMPIMDNDTLNKLIGDWLEMNASNTRTCRDGGYEMFRFADSIPVYPEVNLYPDPNLYPNGGDVSFDRGLYRTCWYDDYETKPYRYILLTFTSTVSGVEKTDTYVYDTYKEEDQIANVNDTVFDLENYRVYDISENAYVKSAANAIEALQLIGDMGSYLKGVKYMPAEMEVVGNPCVLAGSGIQVYTEDGGFYTIILRRTLTGTQTLVDRYESRG